MGEFLKVVSIELLVIHLTFRGAVREKVNCFFWNFYFILDFSWFIYMVVLISGIKQSDSVIHSGGLVTKSCLTLSNPMDCSPPGSSVHGISQARILEWTAMPPPGDLPNPRIKHVSLLSPALTRGFFLPLAPPGSLSSNILFKIIFSFRLLQNIEQSSLCCIVGPCCYLF